MKIAIVGSGAREHALAVKCAEDPRVETVFCIPGNGGCTGRKLQRVPIPSLDVEGITRFAASEKLDFVVIGPDDALAAGMADSLCAAGVLAFGPPRAAAQLESSKSFAKQFMERHSIPTARWRRCSSPEEARAACREFGPPVVVKADGLALGKGVTVAATLEDADAAIISAMEQRVFGDAGTTLVIEECLTGTECSVHALIDGCSFLAFPDARDHKRAYDGDQGPNTGGMGVVSPSGAINTSMWDTILKRIISPFIEGVQKEAIPFRGLLFPGLMITADGPKVLEFNCRFGDPETQTLLRLLQDDLLPFLMATAQGTLHHTGAPAWSQDAAVCVVLASGGYPGPYRKGLPITGLEAASEVPGVEIFHAGTERVQGQLVTAGGRVLSVTATAPTLEEARRRAYQAADLIHFEGKHLRRDIGGPPLPPPQ